MAMALSSSCYCSLRNWRRGNSLKNRALTSVSRTRTITRRLCVYAESNAETSFKSTMEIDRLIDSLRTADTQQFCQTVAENVFSFDNSFWLRLASRAELCQTADDKRDYEELANTIMRLVEKLVQKTEEQIETSTEKLEAILRPVTGIGAEEIVWPPRDPDALNNMKNELLQREGAGSLDESFLSAMSAQLRQAREDASKPGLLALLQKVLQYYACINLTKNSYAITKDGTVDRAEELLEKIISAEVEDWDNVLRSGIVQGGGHVTFEELSYVVNKRIERILLRTESSSYKQRVLVEFLKEIQRRSELMEQAFKK